MLNSYNKEDKIMESDQRYVESYNEIRAALKKVGTDKFEIDFSKLDGISKEKIRSVLQIALVGRINELSTQVTGIRA